MNNAKIGFKKLVEPWVATYDQLIVSAIGVFDGVEKRIVGARVLLAPSFINEHTKILPLQGEIFWGQLEVRPWDPSDFEDLLENIVNGFLIIDSVKASLPKDDGPTPYPIFYSGSHPAFGGNQAPLRFPALVMRGGGRRKILDRVVGEENLEWHLWASSPPFFDLADLYTHFRLFHPAQIGDETQIELMARAPIVIDARSVISEKKARLVLIASRAIDKNLISVGFRALANESGVVRSKMHSKEIRWIENDKGMEGFLEIDVGGAPAIQCFLSYANIGVQQFWVFDPSLHLNMRHAVHSAFDPNQDVVRRLVIEPKDTDSREFEEGVAMLLSMLGFSVTQHGRSQKLSKAPDIVAITPQNRIAVIECTVGLPGAGDQFATVRRRTETLRKSLLQSGWPNMTLYPIVVSALPEAEIGDHKKEASEQGILVICREDLQAGLDRVRLPVDPDQMLVSAFGRLKLPSFMNNKMSTLSG